MKISLTDPSWNIAEQLRAIRDWEVLMAIWVALAMVPIIALFFDHSIQTVTLAIILLAFFGALEVLCFIGVRRARKRIELLERVSDSWTHDEECREQEDN
jgi:hypothetical protein